MIERRELPGLLKKALARGGDFAEIFIEERDSALIVCEEDQIQRAGTGRDAGAGVRVVKGETTAYAYTNDLTPEGLEAACDTVSRASAGQTVKDVTIDLRRREPSVRFTIQDPPEDHALTEKVEIVSRINKAARQHDPRVKQVIVGYRETKQKVTIANSLGYEAQEERTRVHSSCSAVAVEGDKLQTGYETVAGYTGLELFAGDAPEKLAAIAAARAVRMLGAKSAPTGKMPVIMAGQAGGTMVHEACGHGLEADLVQKGLSVYRGKKGEMVASEEVTVVDDPTLPNRYGSYGLDDEGIPAKKSILINKGRLDQYMYDLITSRKDGVESNGHGRRESYHFAPIPRMGNTFIAPGSDDPDRIIAETAKGVYVTKMGGGEVNTVNGDFVFEVTEGYLIENGKIGAPVKGATLTGNGPLVLKIVDRVGRDLGFSNGTCGKDGQGVPVADAQPTIRIPELIVGGVMEK